MKLHEIVERKEKMARDIAINSTTEMIAAINPSKLIDVFQKTFLSNMYPCQVYYKDYLYSSTEVPYQYSKFDLPKLRNIDQNFIEQIQCLLWERYEYKWDGLDICGFFKSSDMQSGMAKRIAKLIPQSCFRDDWDEVKLDIMIDLVYQKYFDNEDLRQMLLNTGDKLLIEGGDVYWGYSDGQGDNHLGRLTMMVRDELRLFGY